MAKIDVAAWAAKAGFKYPDFVVACFRAGVEARAERAIRPIAQWYLLAEETIQALLLDASFSAITDKWAALSEGQLGYLYGADVEDGRSIGSNANRWGVR